MKRNHSNRTLVLIGGAENKEDKCSILQEFVRLAQGNKARITVMTVASERPKELGQEYYRAFKHLGASEVHVVSLSKRQEANDPGALDLIKKATAVFFTGGDQLRITALLGGTLMDRLLHKRHEEGMPLGGTSAGAAMMSSAMIIGGEPQINPRLGIVDMGPGMEFVYGGVIDTHFSQRGRLGRLIAAVAQYPHALGIGIDENTAAFLVNNDFTVLGEGAVTVVDVGAATYTNVPERKRNESLTLFDIKLHVLSEHHSFDMVNRVPFVSKDRAASLSHPATSSSKK